MPEYYDPVTGEPVVRYDPETGEPLGQGGASAQAEAPPEPKAKSERRPMVSLSGAVDYLADRPQQDNGTDFDTARNDHPRGIRNIGLLASLPLSLPAAAGMMAAGEGGASLAEGDSVGEAAKNAAWAGGTTAIAGNVAKGLGLIGKKIAPWIYSKGLAPLSREAIEEGGSRVEQAKALLHPVSGRPIRAESIGKATGAHARGAGNRLGSNIKNHVQKLNPEDPIRVQGEELADRLFKAQNSTEIGALAKEATEFAAKNKLTLMGGDKVAQAIVNTSPRAASGDTLGRLGIPGVAAFMGKPEIAAGMWLASNPTTQRAAGVGVDTLAAQLLKNPQVFGLSTEQARQMAQALQDRDEMSQQEE